MAATPARTRTPAAQVRKGPASQLDPLMTDPEFCEYTGISRGMSAQLRFHGRGPKFIKVTGKQIRYRLSDINAWLDERTRTQSSREDGVA